MWKGNYEISTLWYAKLATLTETKRKMMCEIEWFFRGTYFFFVTTEVMNFLCQR